MPLSDLFWRGASPLGVKKVRLAYNPGTFEERAERMAAQGLKNSLAGEEESVERETESADVLVLTARIVSAHVSNNPVSAADLPQLIRTVYEALVASGEGKAPPLEPAVPIKKSVTPDYIVCLEDGSKHKMLKRHLRTAHEITPEEYREKWGLKADYPMVAPEYAKARSALAKKIGFGRTQRGGRRRVRRPEAQSQRPASSAACSTQSENSV